MRWIGARDRCASATLHDPGEYRVAPDPTHPRASVASRFWPEIAGVHQQVAGLLGHPGGAGMSGAPGDVHAATPVFDHDQEVQATTGCVDAAVLNAVEIRRPAYVCAPHV
jgi:hypothetical protein